MSEMKTNSLKQLTNFLEEKVTNKEKYLQLSNVVISNLLSESVPECRESRHRDVNTKKRGQTTRSGLSAAALNTVVITAESGCVFCGSNAHTGGNCTSPMSIGEWKNTLRDQKRCFWCTKKFHFSRNSRSGTKLRRQMCSGRHLTVMREPNGMMGWSAATLEAARNVRESPSQFIRLSSTPAANRTQVLLQTARDWERCKDTKNFRALLDGGSHKEVHFS